MELKKVMEQKSFVIVGDTLNEEKFACKIKNAMLEHGYEVQCVGKELNSLNDVSGKVDIIDLCINPIKGLQLMKECKIPFTAVVIQPGAENDDLLQYMQDNSIDYIQDCLLVGLREYVDKN